MEIVKILGIALIGTFLALVLKEQKAVFGIAVGILTAVAVFLFFAPTLLEIISYVRDLSSALDGEDAYIRTILKNLNNFLHFYQDNFQQTMKMKAILIYYKITLDLSKHDFYYNTP